MKMNCRIKWNAGARISGFLSVFLFVPQVTMILALAFTMALPSPPLCAQEVTNPEKSGEGWGGGQVVDPRPEAKQPVGVVTALKGKAQVTRAAAETPLRFKDDLILRDVVDTQEKSLTRILFGGKSIVTVRELSRLNIRKEILPTGAARSIYDLSSGGILINVARKLLRPGDEVQIRTLNAIAGVRGTTIFTQFIPGLARSIFILLAGSAIVTPQGLPSVTLTPLTSVSVTGDAATGIQVSPVQPITPAQADKIIRESDVGPMLKEEVQVLQAARAGKDDLGEESGEGWGIGNVVDVAKESLPEPTESSEGEMAEGQASPEAAEAIVEGLINLIPAIIDATQGGKSSSPHPAPRQRGHQGP